MLVLSFIKQCYNYLFIATDNQNILFKNNVIGVILGVIIGLIVIPKRNLLGGVITQIFIEFVYTFGAIRIAHRAKLTPIVQKKHFWYLTLVLILACATGFGIHQYFGNTEISLLTFFATALIFNGIIFLISFKSIKEVAKGLTVD